MNVVDIAAVFVVVAAAVGWLVLRFRSPVPPACHQLAANVDVGAAGADVVVGAALQRGLQRARARQSARRVNACPSSQAAAATAPVPRAASCRLAACSIVDDAKRPPVTTATRKPARTKGRPQPLPSHTKWTGQLLSRRRLVSMIAMVVSVVSVVVAV
jgi:hypothetical protein